ncbi:hypothetical protein SLS63_003495 [Diaporthe eres]|uniref:Uncharacterized protein n=1 Tax=Diaporthe eres TaxID=83184 RepID=A0ABR1PG23_DIAER
MVRTPESKEDAEQFARQLLRLQKWCSENNRTDIEIDPEHLKICQKIWPHEPKVLNKDEDDIPKNWKNTAGAKNAGNQISIYWETAKKAQKTDDEEAEKAAKEAEKAAKEAEKAADEAEDAAEEAKAAAKEAEEAADEAEKAAKDMDDIANDMKNDEYMKKAKDMKKSAEDAKKAAEKAKEPAEKAKKAAEDAKKAKDAKNAKGAQAAAQDAKIAAGDVQKASSQAKHSAELAAKEAKEAKEAKGNEANKANKAASKVKTEPDPQKAIPDTKVKLEYPDSLDDALDLLSNLTLDNNNNLEVEDFGSKGEPDEIYFFRDPFTGESGTVKGTILFTPMNGKCFGFALPLYDGRFKFGFAPVTGQYEKKYVQFQTAYGDYERSRVIIMSKDRELRTLGKT